MVNFIVTAVEERRPFKDIIPTDEVFEEFITYALTEEFTK